MIETIRHALRRIRLEPTLAIAATATLALCIGANTTVFSLVDSVLLRPLPYPDSERICWVYETIGRNRASEIVMAGDYYSIAEESPIFDSVAAFNTSTANWSGEGRPEQLDTAHVSNCSGRPSPLQFAVDVLKAATLSKIGDSSAML